MAQYTECLGGAPDGLCGCGAPATTSIQTGWHNGPTASQSGPQQEELCEACYDCTDEAAHYRQQAHITEACRMLGIVGHGVRISGYGAHPRSAEIAELCDQLAAQGVDPCTT